MQEIELSNQDKEKLLKFVEEKSRQISDEELDGVITKSKKKLAKLKKKKTLPNFVKRMIAEIDDLLLLLDSTETELSVKKKTGAVLHYFNMEEDVIPDYRRKDGYVDDAFVVSDLCDELRREIREFKID